MNREIKFRVWDLEEKRFIEWFNADPMINCSVGSIYCYERTKNEDGSYGPDTFTNKRESDKRLIVQQYTGLKDKNNKEIYEGDIVRTSLHYMFRPNVHVVTYSKNRFVPDDISDASDVEVIGNKFEHPDLLSSVVVMPRNEIADNEDESDLDSCENCGEAAWDGRICHVCGAKNI